MSKPQISSADIPALTIQHVGLTPVVQITVTLSGPEPAVTKTYILGAKQAVGMKLPVTPGAYVFKLNLDEIGFAVTFGYDVGSSDNSLSFTGCSTGSPTSVTSTDVSGTLFGFGFNPRTLTCTMTKTK